MLQIGSIVKIIASQEDLDFYHAFDIDRTKIYKVVAKSDMNISWKVEPLDGEITGCRRWLLPSYMEEVPMPPKAPQKPVVKRRASPRTFTATFKLMVIQEYQRIPMSTGGIQRQRGAVTTLLKKHGLSKENLRAFKEQYNNGGWDSRIAVAFCRRGLGVLTGVL